MGGKIRVLIAKPGLDGHDRGAKVVARALRDAGYEVIYTGLRRTPQEIARMALEEDVNVVGLSLLSGAHNELFPAVISELKKAGLNDVVVFGGGVIPDEDVEFLKKSGLSAVFTPGTPLQTVVDFVKNNVKPR
jgi:methylmalonyl-CoA mutase C-terminal domain/subunit